jgi:hypothetical protein
MRTRDISVLCVLAGVLSVVGTGPAAAQAEIDRVLVRVGDEVITQLDVRRARLLKLVPASATTDADIQRELENHWLMTIESARFSPAPPDQAAIEAERERWLARLGPGTDPTAALERAGMSEAELTTWFRAELTIRTYIEGRFGLLSPGERATAVEAWIRGLRDRAGLRESESQN